MKKNQQKPCPNRALKLNGEFFTYPSVVRSKIEYTILKRQHIARGYTLFLVREKKHYSTLDLTNRNVIENTEAYFYVCVIRWPRNRYLHDDTIHK